VNGYAVCGDDPGGKSSLNPIQAVVDCQLCSWSEKKISSKESMSMMVRCRFSPLAPADPRQSDVDMSKPSDGAISIDEGLDIVGTVVVSLRVNALPPQIVMRIKPIS